MRQWTRTVACLLAALPVMAQADDLQPGIDLGASILGSHMQEMVDGHALVTEKGALPQAGARFFLRNSSLELGAGLQVAAAPLDYYGQSQNYQTGALAAYKTTTDASFVNAELDAALRRGPFTARAFVGYDAWERQVNGGDGVSGATEDYRWYVFGLGASWRFHLQPKLDLMPALDVWDETQVRQHATSGIYDDVHLQPGGKVGARASLAFCTHIASNQELRLRPYIQTFGFGQSNVVQTTEGGQPVIQNGQPLGTYQPEIRYLQGGVDLEMEVTF